MSVRRVWSDFSAKPWTDFVPISSMASPIVIDIYFGPLELECLMAFLPSLSMQASMLGWHSYLHIHVCIKHAG